MGQGWSERGQTGWELADEARVRSEPPLTSVGGRTVGRIVEEDDQLDIFPKEAQLANWKEASGASRILAAKPPSRRTRTTSLQGSGDVLYEHFVDFSMFPDKFSSLYRKSPVGTPTTTSPLHPEDQRGPSEDLMSVPAGRTRSASFSGRLPIFSFAHVPDKNVAREASRRGSLPTSSGSEDSPPGSVVPTIVITKEEANFVHSDDAVVAAVLASEAENPRPTAGGCNKTAKKASRYSFFDYSLIPDKDPRAFVPKSKKGKAELDKAAS